MKKICVRRALGLGVSARIEMLYVVSGAQNVHNLFIQHCAAMLDKSLRATNSATPNRLSWWTGREYGMVSWGATTSAIQPGGILLDKRGLGHGFWGNDIAEEWVCSLLSSAPVMDHRRGAMERVFFSNAEEINTKLQSKTQTFDFHRVGAWYEVGFQVVVASGWRPDCVVSDSCNVPKMLPPRLREECPFVFGNCDATQWLADTTKERIEAPLVKRPGGALEVEAASFYINGAGFSCSCLRTPKDEIQMRSWMFGWDCTRFAPVFVAEFPVLCALRLVKRCILGRWDPSKSYCGKGWWRFRT